MKKLLSITALLAVFFISGVRASNASLINRNVVVSGDTVTASFAVSGNGACKSTIENTLTSNTGVISANWDSTAQVITVTYISSSIQKSQFYRLLAQAGYDNEHARTKDDIYAALPSACQYTRTAPTH